MREWIFKNKIATIVIILLLGLAGSLGAYALMKQTRDTNTNGHDSSDIDKSGVLSGSTLLNPGEIAHFKTVDLKVNSAKSLETVNSMGDIHVTPDGTKFVFVNVTITNTTKTPFENDTFGLITKDGTVFSEADNRYDLVAHDITYDTLNPGVPVTGDVVFTVPDAIHDAYFGAYLKGTENYLGILTNF